MNLNTKTLTRTAMLLALIIASQFIKNTSVYITGSIVNTILIIATMICGLTSGLLLAVISPVTSWLITGSALISALPVLMICIMGGNVILVLCVHYLSKKFTEPGSMVIGSVLKALFMWVTMVKLVLNLMFESTGLPAKALSVAQVNFSTTQLITALIGSAIAFIICKPLKKYVAK